MDARARILVIDDESEIREACRRALASGGFAVEEARDGKEGWSKIQGAPVDLVLLDVSLRGALSLDLLNRIRARDPDVICILMAEPVAAGLATNLVRQGAYDFLLLPFTSDALLLAVERGLERRRLQAEARRLRSFEAEAQRLTIEKARLEELDKAKAAFIRLVSHELQSPAAAVQSYLQLILDGYIQPDKQREIVAKAAARASEEITLIQDLLELGRLQGVKDRGRVIPVRLNEVLEQALESLRDQAAQKGLRLTVDVAPDVPPVLGVVGEFKSLWTNLISNAVKYTPAGGEVTVSLRTDGKQAIGQVSDTGIGISPDARERLFTEFYRAENARASSLRGTGLGLAIVKRIVEEAGGQIWVESELGRGSSFTFVLPAATGPVTAVEAPAAESAEQGGVLPVREGRTRLWVVAKATMPALLARWAEGHEVFGPVAAGDGHFEFARIEEERDLRLDYNTSILPPKKVLLPQREALFSFRQGATPPGAGGIDAQPVLDDRPRVLAGIHTCDLHAFRLLDAVFASGQQDEHYRARRGATRVISVECLAPCDSHAFCKSMNTLSATDGFDLHMVDLGDAYAIQVGTAAGEALLGDGNGIRPAAEADFAALNRILAEKWPRFPYRLDFDGEELPSLMALSYKSPLWRELGERCLACGACNLVCPTCYCFNVLDEVALDGTSGERVRTWDSCQLDEFARVATGENFRETRAQRQRHRFFRKGKYIPDVHGELGCVGCGRCARACLVHITPVEVWNGLHAEHGRDGGAR
jgi:sulfhydrogenase subunit beta (sulfur reductase)